MCGHKMFKRKIERKVIRNVVRNEINSRSNDCVLNAYKINVRMHLHQYHDTPVN